MSSPCRSAGGIIDKLHQAGDESAWWKGQRVNALEIAKGLWKKTHAATDTYPLEHSILNG